MLPSMAHEKLTWRRVDNAETRECFLNKRGKLRQITVADNEFQEETTAAAAAAAVNSRVSIEQPRNALRFNADE